jgi:hypothetical protein
MALVTAFYQGTNFANPVTKSVDVGSSSNRAGFVFLGRHNNSTPLPVSVTIGTDSLTARGSTFTDVDGRSWRLYAGALTVTGTQTVTGNYDSGLGFAAMLGVVWDDVDAAVIESLQTGAAYTTTPSFTVSSATGDTVVAMLIQYATAGRSLTASSPATLETVTDGGGTTGANVMTEAGASSVTIDGTWSGSAGWVGVAFSIPDGGGGPPPSSILPIIQRIRRG